MTADRLLASGDSTSGGRGNTSISAFKASGLRNPTGAPGQPGSFRGPGRAFRPHTNNVGELQKIVNRK